MSVAKIIQSKLEAAFRPAALKVEDVSAAHRGHAGAREAGESHFRVTMTADAFAGKTRLERERAVHAVLKRELAGPVHALTLSLKAPGE